MFSLHPRAGVANCISRVLRDTEGELMSPPRPLPRGAPCPAKGLVVHGSMAGKQHAGRPHLCSAGTWSSGTPPAQTTAWTSFCSFDRTPMWGLWGDPGPPICGGPHSLDAMGCQAHGDPGGQGSPGLRWSLPYAAGGGLHGQMGTQGHTRSARRSPMRQPHARG